MSLPFKPAEFFVFRTALLPFRVFEEWGSDLTATEALATDLDAAVASDKLLLRERLLELFRNPVLQEALFLASPDLVDALPEWYKDPHSPENHPVERTLVKYLSRLCGRSTPFGLFAGCSVGRLGNLTRIATLSPDTYIRHTRPDMDYMCHLVSVLTNDPTIARLLTYTPNTSLYIAAGRLHYCEARQKGKKRSYHLVAVELTSYLENVLAWSTEGACFGDMAARLVDAEITLDDANAFIQELIQSQILIPDLEPAITGPEPLHAMIATLAALPHEGANAAAEVLTFVRDELAAIDACPLGLSPERYAVLADRLRTLPAPVEINRLFQTDLVKPAPDAELGGEVIEEIQSVIETLWRFRDRPEDPFMDFKQAFRERYEEGQEVPLSEALDEENGIGFSIKGGIGIEDAPLLEGLPFGEQNNTSPIHWGPWENWLSQRLLEHQTSGNLIFTVTQKDLEPFLSHNPENLPDAFSIRVNLMAKSQEALDEGDFKIHLMSGSGPSGMNLLGRFCHGDPILKGHVEGFLHQEESYHPNVIYAEIVHLPEGRLGNVILRPTLRGYEIPYLGRSGVDKDHQILCSDLLVSVSNGRVVLRSKRVGMEVVPRLTNAHHFQSRSLGVYRFLCMLQHQHPSGRLGWDWGPMSDLPFLPRVELGRTVLSKARWRIKGEEIKSILGAQFGARMKALREWMTQRKLPRLILLSDDDNKLPVDLHNALSVDAFLDLVKSRPGFTLEEFSPDAPAAFSPEGSFLHELVLPFLAVRQPSAQLVAVPTAPTIARSFPPGSEWLYAKIYAGHAGVDFLLRGLVSSLVEEALRNGIVDKWFFVRYTDPGHHLRLRFHGDPYRLCSEVLPQLQRLLKPHLASGLVSKVEINTYKREVERYGSDSGLPLCENIFCADSKWVLAILQRFQGDAFSDQRWRLAILGCDRLLQDFEYSIEQRLQIFDSIRENFREEFAFKGEAAHALGKRFRQERKDLEAILWGTESSSLNAALPLLDERSRDITDSVSCLRALGAVSGGLDLDRLLYSLLHMTCNRILRSAQRPQELVIADFMVRLYKSKLAKRNATTQD